MLSPTALRRRLGATVLAGAIALGGLAACSGGESAERPSPDVRSTPIGAWAIEAATAITGDEASDDADAFASMWATAHGPDAWLDILTGSELAEAAALRHLGSKADLGAVVEELRATAPED